MTNNKKQTELFNGADLMAISFEDLHEMEKQNTIVTNRLNGKQYKYLFNDIGSLGCDENNYSVFLIGLGWIKLSSFLTDYCREEILNDKV